jgi:hypothetical protein
MRRVSAEEFYQWCEDHPVKGEPFPNPGIDILVDMEDEGILFEIDEIEGNEYPRINANHWKPKDIHSGSEITS